MAIELTYSALQVQQTPTSKPFYLLSCNAQTLLKWCDVPRKKESFMAGYQRELGDRHEKIAQFFRADPEHNIIPNSVIIAAREDAISFEPAGTPGQFICKIRVEEKSFSDLLASMIQNLKARLSAEELASIAIRDQDAEGSEEDEEESTPPESYLATIVQQLENANGDLDGIGAEFKAAVEDYVQGVSKPGLIIDGQHRVFGAKNVSEFDINLPVVLLPGLDYREQVFHFYVLNNKAKPLTKTELRTIVATSLSKREIGELYDRFKQVGVTAEQTEWTFRMNEAEYSPFKGLINFALPGSRGVIPENVAYQVVSKFLNPHKKHKLLFKDVAAWNAGDGSQWAYRLETFFALWRGVKAKYPVAWAKAVAGENGQILQKVNLLVLQEYLIDTLNSEMPRRSARGEASPFADPEQLEEEIGFALEFLKEDFYLKEWRLKGLDTATGHTAFRTAVADAIAGQSSNLGNMRLFRASQ